MRISQAVIHGGRPVTRFTIPAGHRRQRQLGLRQRATIVALAGPLEVSSSPLVAIRRAARGLGQTAGRQTAGRQADDRTLTNHNLHRSDTVRWSRRANGDHQRARPRSAAPWRV